MFDLFIFIMVMGKNEVQNLNLNNIAMQQTSKQTNKQTNNNNNNNLWKINLIFFFKLEFSTFFHFTLEWYISWKLPSCKISSKTIPHYMFVGSWLHFFGYQIMFLNVKKFFRTMTAEKITFQKCYVVWSRFLLWHDVSLKIYKSVS